MARKQKTIHYLYKTTCLVTGKYYIGMHSTCNLDDGYMGSGKRLRYSIHKHGVENHVKKILEFFKTRDLLIEAEKKAITPEIITDKNCMNLKGGGEGGFSNEEHKENFFAAHSKGRETYKKRLAEDEAFRNKHLKNAMQNFVKGHSSGKVNYNTFSGKTHSDETKLKISKAKKNTGIGKTNSQYGTCWVIKNNISKKIKKEELNLYLGEGWVNGRKILYTDVYS
jgi:hypothetical protein